MTTPMNKLTRLAGSLMSVEGAPPLLRSSRGVAFATVIIYFALSNNNFSFDWWGNTIVTMDTKSTPWKAVSKGQYFGPGPGEF